MKEIVVVMVWLLFPMFSFGQEAANEFDPKKWEPPYSLGFPKDWEVERFLIPIAFAPQIPFKGVEDIRFMPGWGKAESPEYWSYAFLWYLDGHPSIKASTIETNLKDYYNGLVGAMRAEETDENRVSVKTIFQKGKKQKGDLETFFGSVYMLDYKSNKPISLYVKVHHKSCRGQNKTFLFFEVSPKHYTSPIWDSLDGLWREFRCEKPENKP
jgi:hypothetical protein